MRTPHFVSWSWSSAATTSHGQDPTSLRAARGLHIAAEPGLAADAEERLSLFQESLVLFFAFV